MNVAKQLVRGFLMGSADIVPGVSGGTVALLLGIYTTLVDTLREGAHALSRLLKGDVSGFVEEFKAINWLFIIPLGVGVLAAVGALSGIIETNLADHPEAMAGLFLGLVAASVVVAWALIRQPEVLHYGIAALVAIAIFALLGFSNGPVSDPSPIVFGVVGAIAICAMILPGISGSFIMLMLGMYAAVLGAVHDREFVSLAIFMVGAVIGLALFSSLLGYLLDHYHDVMMAALVGLMIGSIRVLWPWPNGVGIISEEESEVVSGTGLELPTADNWLWPTVLAVVAAAIVIGLSRFADHSTAAETEDALQA